MNYYFSPTANPQNQQKINFGIEVESKLLKYLTLTLGGEVSEKGQYSEKTSVRLSTDPFSQELPAIKRLLTEPLPLLL